LQDLVVEYCRAILTTIDFVLYNDADEIINPDTPNFIKVYDPVTGLSWDVDRVRISHHTKKFQCEYLPGTDRKKSLVQIQEQTKTNQDSSVSYVVGQNYAMVSTFVSNRWKNVLHFLDKRCTPIDIEISHTDLSSHTLHIFDLPKTTNVVYHLKGLGIFIQNYSDPREKKANRLIDDRKRDHYAVNLCKKSSHFIIYHENKLDLEWCVLKNSDVSIVCRSIIKMETEKYWTMITQGPKPDCAILWKIRNNHHRRRDFVYLLNWEKINEKNDDSVSALSTTDITTSSPSSYRGSHVKVDTSEMDHYFSGYSITHVMAVQDRTYAL
jgi:hypothetical protein